MKFFEAAYNLLNEMTELDIQPTSQLYNAIMAGDFRENNICRGLAVHKQMKNADVKPDTYSYLIYYAKNEKVAVNFSKHFKYMRK